MNYKSKKVTKKSLIWGAVALAVAGGGAKYFWPTESAQAKSAVQTVTTFVVEQRDFPVVLDATGSSWQPGTAEAAIADGARREVCAGGQEPS